MEAQEKSFRENIAQMQKRIKEIKAHRREQEKMLEHKQKVSMVGPWQCLRDDAPERQVGKNHI